MASTVFAPVISVVIPSFNYARFLPDCLGSIFSQTDAPEYEVIVVDDGSTDNTMEVLEAWRRPNLRIVSHQRNRGHVATINEALQLATGSIITRIDPDDRYRPHFMSAVHEKLREYPDVGLVYGNAAMIDAVGGYTGEVTARIHPSDFTGSEYLALLRRNFICAPTVAARRDVWLQSLPVPEGLAFHDWYFTLLAARRYAFYFIDDVLADYRVHSTNHHSMISQNGSEERSVLWLLDTIYAQEESDRAIEQQKQRVRRRVYAQHYLDFAEKYFWFRRSADARRCYAAAAMLSPGTVLNVGVMRRFAATMLGRRPYDSLKTAWTRLRRSPATPSLSDRAVQ